MDELRRIFAQESRPSNEQCILVRMFRALETYRSKKSPRIVFLDTINLSGKFDSWKSQLYDIATWMMSCEEFAQLPAEDKEVIFKSSWIPWEKFERLQVTLQVFGEEAIEKKMMLTSENKAFNRDTVRLEWGSFTDHDPASIKEMFSRFGSRMTDEVARPLFEMNIDNFELSYILCALIWHVEGKNIHHSTRIQAEAVLDRISDELHDHYTYDLRMPNYAARLTRIMEIISSVEAMVVELARMFDVFKFDVTEKDLFVC
ncbi:unnamed protein product [Heligmosomoides polygyrus]|uniref:NR LBD domain-containing protein n=1 Tax=Heligmosomoides polygyrus TaxID=6339 RepID=A0A3P8EZV5_HELPZ|nr:unnamed protein product [Heligmosomoides polygyrus]